MTLQNRVTPFGEVVAIPERGTMMGNRGGRIHHNDRRELQSRRWASKQWITCVLEFKGRHRAVMSPNRYTELFFLDEATAFAAGHRPCAECRRADFKRFVAAWTGAVSAETGQDLPVRAPDVDAVLQAERIRRDGTKVTYEARLTALPTGTFVELRGRPWLVLGPDLCLWTPAGYTDRRACDNAIATVLTPRSIVEAFAAGYLPGFHASA